MKKILNCLSHGIIISSVCFSAHTMAEDAKSFDTETKITIDVPVTLKEAYVVFNMNRIILAGETPFGMKYMDLLNKKRIIEKIPGKIIGVFHGHAAFMTLNDQAYNADRRVTTGNPYKILIEGLLASGVQIEECAVSMKANGWTNKDLLPGIKVNTGAISRIVQLTQEGYVQIQP